MQEDGKWKPYNVAALEKNINLVFRTGDIRKLNKLTYDFIILHMSFIAHYNLYGFQEEYADLDMFRRALQTSEYSQDPEANLRWADNNESDSDFLRWYGYPYCHSVAEGIRLLVKAARQTTAQHAFSIPSGEEKL